MLSPKTTDSAEELENAISDMQAAGATALALVECGSGEDREMKRWTVGPTFRPASLARQIQARADRETVYGRQYVVLAWKGDTLLDRVFPDPSVVQGELVHAASASATLATGTLDPVVALVPHLLENIQTLVRVNAERPDNVLERYERFADQQAAHAQKLAARVTELEAEVASLRKVAATVNDIDAVHALEIAKLKTEDAHGTAMWNDMRGLLPMVVGHWMKGKGGDGALPSGAADAALRGFCTSLDVVQITTIVSCLREPQQALFSQFLKHYAAPSGAASGSASTQGGSSASPAPASTEAVAAPRAAEPTLLERTLAVGTLLFGRMTALEAILTPAQVTDLAHGGDLAATHADSGVLPDDARAAFVRFFDTVTDDQMAKLNATFTVAELRALQAFSDALRAPASPASPAPAKDAAPTPSV